MFNTSTTVQNAVAARLHKNYSDLPSFWAQLISDCQTRAYNEIVSRLAARGFSAAQIAAWDRGAEFELSLTAFWAITDGAGLEGADDKFLAKLDRREELDTVAVTSGGTFSDPAGTAGLPSTGSYDTSTDMFVFDQNDEDPRRGTETVW